MKYNYRLTPIILLLCALVTLSGCSEDRKYKIGISQCSQDDWRTKMNDEINREIMCHEDAVVEIRSADDSSKKQIEDIKYFADNGFDIVIVAPNEAAELTPVVKEVYERGIPVIIFDRNIIGDSYTARISVDNEGLGRVAARYANHLVGGSKKVLEIYGLVGSTPADDRHRGFTEEFKKYGGEVLAGASAGWREKDAVQVADSLLSIYKDVDLIYAHNDRMAIGASTVAKRLGRDEIKIIGIDAAPEVGIKAVADSVIDATFMYPTEGYRLIQTALAILKGNPYEREVQIPYSSAVDLSNADILLLQYETMRAETSKMILLKQQIDSYWEKHSSQTMLFYASIVIIVLLCGVLFLILRSYWQHRKHQAALIEKNKLLEEQRDAQKRLNEQLEAATKSKLMFFTNVSHDLRTPLTLIAEPVALLSHADNLTDQQMLLTRLANKNVKILQRLINQILDFRKYENGKLELTRTEINLGEAVKDWVESFRTVARKLDIQLKIDVPENKSIIAAVDVEKIERVVFNLMSNAMKYTPRNGTITMTCDADDGKVYLKVSDTGIGIAERDLGNIFERFYQVEREHPQGSGIGLTLCKAFVELHGGSIGVESAPGKGSVFTVELPLVEGSDKAETIDSAMAGDDVAVLDDVETELDVIDADGEVSFDKHLPLVLIIDNNKDMQSLLTLLLRDKYNVICADKGKDGIKKAAKYVPDLIICDVMMPGIDGLECCRRIKSEVSTSHIPVLMLTACGMDEQRVQCYDSGCDAYVSKPFSSSVLLSRCESLISNRKRIMDLWGKTNEVPHIEERERLPKSDIDNDFYNRFLDIFKPQMGNPDINVDAMAAKMGLERSQFYRKIKALTNYSPVELIRNFRLKEGRKLLIKTDKTISEIAYEIGFSSPAYFTKCYREAYGETPSETREGKQSK